MSKALDQLLARHCAPALAGVKASNLVSCDRAEFPNLRAEAEEYNLAFAGRGVRLAILCRRKNRQLLLVYHRARLELALADPMARRLLRGAGYRLDGTVEELLEQLRGRLREGEDFPHEIGVFLGYPPEDVLGFQRQRGEGCKLCGYWKVYSDVERARRLFHRYDCCSRALCRRVEQGCSVKELFGAAS